MEDPRYTFFEQAKKSESASPRLEIIEKLQAIFTGANQNKQPPEPKLKESVNSTEAEGILQEEISQEQAQSIDSDTPLLPEATEPSDYFLTKPPIEIEEMPPSDTVTPQDSELEAKPKLLIKLGDMLSNTLGSKLEEGENRPIPDIVQKIDAVLSGDFPNQSVDTASSVTETKITYHPPGCPPSHCVTVSGGTVPTCESFLVPFTVLTSAVVQIPVVLSQFQVQLNINSLVTLPEQVLEIKEIKKATKVTQCLLIQEPDVTLAPGDTGNLFLKGFIRKNIAYATRDCTNSEGVCGDIRHCTVDVPWNCVATVTFTTPPNPPQSNEMAEFQFSRRQSLTGLGFAEKDQLLSADFSEYNQVSQEYFNELPYCELVSSRIVEYDEFLGRRPVPGDAPFKEKEFNKIEEKMILTLELRLLQKQLVRIGGDATGRTLVPLSQEILETTLIEDTRTEEPVAEVSSEDDLVEIFEEILEETLDHILEETWSQDSPEIGTPQQRPSLTETPTTTDSAYPDAEEFPRVNNLAQLQEAVADFLEENSNLEEDSEASLERVDPVGDVEANTEDVDLVEWSEAERSAESYADSSEDCPNEEEIE